MSFKTNLLQAFTWWNGATWGTRFFTWRKGEFVGQDEFGNRYYRYAQPNFPLKERRWVVYNGLAEPSRIPPGWYGWMCQRTDVPPTEERFRPREWIKPHLPNMTGTPLAYRPKGSLSRPGAQPKAYGGDYEPWSPN